MKDRIIDTLANKPRALLTAMIVLAGAGMASYLTLPREADPDIPIPIVYVAVALPGISPQDAERLIVKPLEQELRSIEGLEELNSVAAQGFAGILLEFDVSFDKDEALDDVREKVDLVRPKLPADVEEPLVLEFNTSLFPVIVAAVSGDVPERTLYRYARVLQDKLETIPSVLEAELVGEREEVLEIIVSPARLESFSVPYESLVNLVVRQNRLIAAGSLQSEQGRFPVKVPGLFEDWQDVASMPLVSTSEGTVTLGDIAQLRRTFKDPESFARFNGRPAIVVEITKRLGSNITATAKEVRRITEEVTAGWPDEIHVDLAQDASVWIDRTLTFLESAILTAVLLVMIVVVGALGLRSGALVGISIPTSFMVAFFILGLMGLTINMMVMFAMVLAVGILVDGAIVVVEYADRKMAEGEPRKIAYALAAKRMFWPIVSSTATTLAAFLPMLFWPGVSGQFMSYLPTTLIIILISSMCTALIFLPVIGNLFGKTAASGATQEKMLQLAGQSSGRITDIDGFTGFYVRTLARVIQYPFRVLSVTFAALFAIFWLFSNFNNGTEFFVQTEPERGVAIVSARGNLSTREMLRLAAEVEREVINVPGVQYVYSSIGGGGGDDRGDGITDVPPDMIAQIWFELLPFEERRKGLLILEDIRWRTISIPGIKTEIRKFAEGPPTGKDLQVEFTGDNLPVLYAAAGKLRDHLETNVSALVDIEDSRPLPGIEWILDIDRELAGRYDADTASIGAAVQLVTDGILIGEYRPDDAEEEVDIRLRFPPEARVLDQLDSLRLQTSSGLIPVSNFVERSHAPQLNNISRVDGKRRVLLKANTSVNPATGEKFLADDKIAELTPWMRTQDFGEGVNWRFRGANEEQAESAAFLQNAMLGALFLMFLILLTQFNSFYHSFLTLFTVILSVAGVLVGMLVTGQTFSVIMTGTGVVALAGIVVNNAIVLIDTYHRLLREFPSVVEAVLRTAAQRLRPVLLTTVTTICGLLPMALQININFFDRSLSFGSVVSVWWVQLSTAVIFGLGFATMLTLILVPVMLAAPAVLRERFGRPAPQPVEQPAE